MKTNPDHHRLLELYLAERKRKRRDAIGTVVAMAVVLLGGLILAAAVFANAFFGFAGQ